MIRPRLRQLSLYHEPLRLMERGPFTSIRHFSLTRRQATESTEQPSGNGGSTHGSGRSPSRVPVNRSRITLIRRVANSDRTRPQRVVDARSLAVPQAGGQPANVLRAPKLRSIGNTISARRLKPRSPPMPITAKAGPKRRREGRPRPARRQSEEEEGDDVRAAQIESVIREQSEKNRPTPIRYNPQVYDFSALKETWPSLPTGTAARVSSVFEKLSWLSDRYPNGYVPPQELGKRLFGGQNVLFLSEEEKVQAVEEARKLAQQCADKLSQRKGDLVEPEEAAFEQISAEIRETLIRGLVKGEYPKLERPQADKSPVLGEVLKNLRNNQTYQTVGKSSQFVAKLESLLATSRHVKQA